MPIRYDKFNSMLEFRFEIRAEQPFSKQPLKHGQKTAVASRDRQWLASFRIHHALQPLLFLDTTSNQGGSLILLLLPDLGYYCFPGDPIKSFLTILDLKD